MLDKGNFYNDVAEASEFDSPGRPKGLTCAEIAIGVGVLVACGLGTIPLYFNSPETFMKFVQSIF